MLKVNIDMKKGARSFEIGGPLAEITTDVASLIWGIYNAVKTNDPKRAEMFRRTMIEMVIDRDTPLWDMKEGDSMIVAPGKRRTEDEEANPSGRVAASSPCTGEPWTEDGGTEEPRTEDEES